MSIESSANQPIAAQSTPVFAVSETDSSENAARLPLHSSIRCVEWSWGESLRIAAVYGDFNLIGVGAKEPSRVGKRIQEMLGQQNLTQIRDHFQQFIERKVDPGSIDLQLKLPSRTVYLKLDTVAEYDSAGNVSLFSYFQDMTALKAAENQARLLRQVVDSIPSWIFIKNTDHNYEMVNSAYADFYGTTPEQCVGKNSVDLGVPREIAEGCEIQGIRGFWQDDNEVFQSGQSKEILSELIVVDGETKFLQTIKTPIHAPDSDRQLLVGFCHDITYLKQIEARIGVELRYSKSLIEVGKLLRRSNDFGSDVRSQICETLKNALECEAVFVDLFEDAERLETKSPDSNLQLSPIECKGVSLGTLVVEYASEANEDDDRINALLTNVADKLATHLHNQQLIAKTNFQANHDSLTGLPNRHYFGNQLKTAARLAATEGKLCAVALMDLDGFKRINDSLGHHVGDKILLAVAKRLNGITAANEVLARFGGDEFAILINDLESQEQGIEAAQRFLDAIQRPFELEGRELNVGASFGISFSSDDDSGNSSMVQRADSAMYFAKASGRNHCQRFTNEIADQANNRLQLEQSLRRAMSNGDELFMVYQPIVDLNTMKATGVEALIRWNDPDRGLVMPTEFIPMAEESGLILQLSEWIMRNTFAAVANWNRILTCPIRLSVNVTPRELEQVDFDQRVLRQLEAVDLDPQHLNLEVTETFMMKRFEEVSVRLGRLRSRGVEIAIDDFGAGYSCMSYLQHLPVDCLKVDRSFVSSLDFDPQQCDLKGLAIAQAIVTLAKSVGLKTIAEGIETENQLQHSVALGADAAQGYLLSQPLSESATLEFFLQQQLKT